MEPETRQRAVRAIEKVRDPKTYGDAAGEGFAVTLVSIGSGLIGAGEVWPGVVVLGLGVVTFWVRRVWRDAKFA